VSPLAPEAMATTLEDAMTTDISEEEMDEATIEDLTA
jgi:hypothetical protein